MAESTTTQIRSAEEAGKLHLFLLIDSQCTPRLARCPLLHPLSPPKLYAIQARSQRRDSVTSGPGTERMSMSGEQMGLGHWHDG